MTITDDAVVYYDPYDLDIAADPWPDVRQVARGSAALPQRALPLLGDLAAHRRREGDRELGDVLQLPQRHLELVNSDFDMPKGVMMFEDPPVHTMLRG
jgi:hypothetical protein